MKLTINTYFKPMSRYMLLAGLLVCSIGLFAQTPTEDLEAEELEVVKSFNAQLEEANKKTTQPSLPPIKESGRPPLTYGVPAKLLSIEYDAPVIRPIAMRTEPLPTVYNFWSKLGFGTPWSPYAELIYNNGKTEKTDFYARVKHHSANATKKQENQRFADNEAEVKGKYFLQKGQVVGANLGLNLDQVHFYGYPQEDTSFAKEDVFQRFTTVFGGLNFGNSKLNAAKVNYNAGLDFYTHNDRYDSGEVGFNAELSFLKWIKDQHYFEVVVEEHFRNFNDSIPQSTNVVSLSPSFTFKTNTFKMKIGAWLGTDGDFAVYPDVKASLFLLNGSLEVFAGWDGTIKQNSFRQLSDFNPFIKSRLTIKNSRIQNRYGGFKGKIDVFGFEARVSQRPVENMALYLNDTLDARRFEVLYDDISEVNIHATLSATLLNKLEVLVGGDFYIYNTFMEASAWHLPNMVGNVSAKYSPIPKLDVKGEFYVGGGASYKDALGFEKTQKAIFDFNFGAHYQVTPQLGAYFDLNNVTGSNFQRWHRYPQYGFNLMGGITLKF